MRNMYIHDFELCDNPGDLARALMYINRNGYMLVSITQDASGKYTVFFRRSVDPKDIKINT